MASVEKRGTSYRIVFRHDGRKITRSLQTADHKAPKAAAPAWRIVSGVSNGA